MCKADHHSQHHHHHKHEPKQQVEGVAPDRREFMAKSLAGLGLLLLAPSWAAATSQGKGKGMAPGNKPVAAAMAASAATFLKSLKSEQQAKAALTFDTDQRLDWYFVPRARKGIPLKELDEKQRVLAHALLTAGLSQQGLTKAQNIISLEPVLAELENDRVRRDPELYYVTIFGRPDGRQPWGWSFEGHHLSLNFTVVNNKQVVATPAFMGTNPAEVRHGARKGFRALSAEEDLARVLLGALDDSQRKQAVLSDKAPDDILSSNKRKAEPVRPAGLSAAQLSQKQQELLMNLLKEYAQNMPAEVAKARLDKVRAAGFGQIHFAWAGALERGQAHYYRIQGPSFLVEYDNIQNNANHIHSVWRDFNGDFGLDLLARHYEQSHHQTGE